MALQLCTLGLLSACGQSGFGIQEGRQAWSDPGQWDEQFMRGAQSTEQCEVDTVANLRSRTSAQGPYSIAEYENAVIWRAPGFASSNSVSRQVRRNFTDAHSIYAFLLVDRSESGGRGITGYVVALGECIIHLDVTGHVF